MAQTSKKKSPSTARTTSKTPARPERKSSKPPHRREIMAVVCFILGVFSFIGYFDAEPVFINFLTGFVYRLIGYGFYALPPALIMCSVVLAFHRGRPVLLRTICTLLLAVVTGAIVHLFRSSVEYEISFLMLGELWKNGAGLSSGGVLGGTVSEIFLWLFGKVGAAIALICATVLLSLVAFNATIAGLAEAFGRRERRKYIPEPDPEPLPEEEYPQYQEQPKRPYRYNMLLPLWKKRKIDIPIDESTRSAKPDYFSDEADEKLFKKNPRVKTPDQAVSDGSLDNPVKHGPSVETGAGNKSAATDDSQAAAYDLPLDIPFMEGKSRRPPPVVPPIIEERFATADEPAAAPKPKKRKPPLTPIELDPDTTYRFPPLELLSRGENPHGDIQSRAGSSEMRLNTERLEAAFQSFGVNVNISNATRGPSVTRYEAELEAGVKLVKLTSLDDDIAMALGVSGVRIAAMPDRISTVGIEVPNKSISKVNLRDVIESQEFSQARSKLTFAIGMDISGDPIVGNVPKLPHLLVAGTTGSGKSVCLNSIILSILYKATPEDVRFIMIDPKMVELNVYNNIPHLLVPVVTDIKKAAGSLQWATYEMEKRYMLFKETNARDITGYNQVARKSGEEREPIPQIIVVIDELADLMMMASKDVEEYVVRIAQKGRAAGIYLIIATQSPRANVITGLMKANIPSRIAFKVASALESQIILDPGQNADKLVGNGDMLYAPIGSDKPMRIQGTWVTDTEREKVVGYIKKSGESQYSEEVMGEIEKATVERSSGDKSSGEPGDNDYDELLPQAADVIFETGQASVSMLQRRLKLGYSRAARIVDQMEEMGIVGPFEGSKPRTVLIDKNQWRQMQYTSGVAPADKHEPEPALSVSDFSGDDYLPD